MGNRNILFLVEVSIFSALALLLDFISFKIWAQGGSVSLSMIPVFLIAFRWGIKGGMLTGLLYGVLQIVTGQAWIASVPQAILDYIIAFTILGVAGLLARRIKESLSNQNKLRANTFIVLGILIGSSLRFIAHFLAGIIFFADYAPEGTPVVIYSLIYNGSYMLPAFIISAIIISFLVSSSKRILFVN